MVPALGVTSAGSRPSDGECHACVGTSASYVLEFSTMGQQPVGGLLYGAPRILSSAIVNRNVVSGFFRAFGLHDPGHNLSDNVLAFRRFGEFAVVLACYTKRWAATSLGKPSAL